MGLPSMPSAAEAFFPVVLVANALGPLQMLSNGLQRMLGRNSDDDEDVDMITREYSSTSSVEDEGQEGRRRRDGVRLRRFRSVGSTEDGRQCCCCCVCLHGFEGEQEVSQVLSCRHLFHRGCLDGWLDRMHTTCPLCRSAV